MTTEAFPAATYVRGPALGELLSGGHTYTYREVRYEPADWEVPLLTETETAPWYEVDLDLDFLGGVEVRPQGVNADGRWGVDVALTTQTAPITPELASHWGHALIAASQLADALNAGVAQ